MLHATAPGARFGGSIEPSYLHQLGFPPYKLHTPQKIKLNLHDIKYSMPEQKEYVISLKSTKFKRGKKRAPHAIRILQEAIRRRIKEGEVKLDPDLNSFVWSKGIRNFPKKVEVIAEREKGDEPWIVKLKTQRAEAPKDEEEAKGKGASGESIAQGN